MLTFWWQVTIKSQTVLLLVVALVYSDALSNDRISSSSSANAIPGRVAVIGKVIIDEYYSPEQDRSEAILSVGGGGPQAAWGAAAALATQSWKKGSLSPPPPQPITFFGPVGDVDWTEEDERALSELLNPAVSTIELVRGPLLRTPRIQLWHDEEQNMHWKPLHNSFAVEGADSLWRNRPSAKTILEKMGETEPFTLHIILEAGACATGAGNDAKPFLDSALSSCIALFGVEPVAFPNDETGRISSADAESCSSLMTKLSHMDNRIISPDMHLFNAVTHKEFCPWDDWEVAVRNGPHGSFINRKLDRRFKRVPASRLCSLDRKPVNPTGAGNAYSAAFTTCRGSGLSILDSACIATAIGGIVCEYNHLPPWTPSTFDNIAGKVDEVKQMCAERHLNSPISW